MASPEFRIAQLEGAVRALIGALETLITFEGSAHTLRGTQVGLAMRPLIDQARGLLENHEQDERRLGRRD